MTKLNQSQSSFYTKSTYLKKTKFLSRNDYGSDIILESPLEISKASFQDRKRTRKVFFVCFP